MRELSFRFLCPRPFFFFLESELVKSSSTREKDGKIVARGVYFNAPNFTIFLERGNVFYACFAKTSHSAFEFACFHRFRLGPTSCSATTTSETTKSPLLPFFFFFRIYFNVFILYSQGSPVERNSNLKYEKIPR